MKKEHTLWIERFRTLNIDNYIGNDELKNDIRDFISSNDIPHLLFVGTAGVGKTTLAKLIVHNIKCDHIYINASDENGIDTIREKIKGFASSATFNPLKVIILDEADYLTQPAQAALRFLIEEYSLNTRFILTCNYIEKLIEPLTSRCEIHKISPPTKGEVARFVCTNILDVEKIKYNLDDIVKLINQFYPDIRSIVKNLQKGTKNKEFSFKEVDLLWCNKVIELLQKPNKNSWIDIRQVIANASVDDYQPLIEILFEKVSLYGKGNEAQIIIEIDEAQWRSRAVPDKEINIVALISKILNILGY